MIREVRIKTAADESGVTGNMEVTAVVENRFENEMFLWAAIADEEGNEADRIFPLPLEENMQFCMRIPRVRLWDAEGVYLYDLVLEIRDAQGQVLENTVKKIAFYSLRCDESGLSVNGKTVRVRAVRLRETADFFKKCRQFFCNTVVVPEESDRDRVKEKCLEYGLYMVTEKEWKEMPDGQKMRQSEDGAGDPKDDAGSSQSGAGGPKDDAGSFQSGARDPENNPDFGLNVVQQGVLIENRCVFQNVSDYILRCTVREENGSEGKVLQSCEMSADIPPGTSRYIEYPFEPLPKAGKYIYRAELIRKKDTAWAAGGDAAAREEAVIMNFFGI